MMTGEHRILRQRIELVARDVALARELQERVSRLQREKTIDLLDAICGELGRADRVEVVDELVVDLGELDATRFEAAFLRELASGLRAGLAQALEGLRRRSSPRQQRANRLAALLATFARAGALPRESEAKRPDLIDAALRELLQLEPEMAVELASSLLAEPIAARRLLRHASDGALAQLIRYLEPRWASGAEAWVREVKAWAVDRASGLRGAGPLWHEVVWREVFRSAGVLRAGSAAPVASGRGGAALLGTWTRGALAAWIEEPAQRERAWSELMARLERVLGSAPLASDRATGLWAPRDGLAPGGVGAAVDAALPAAAGEAQGVAAAEGANAASRSSALRSDGSLDHAELARPEASAPQRVRAAAQGSPLPGEPPEPRVGGVARPERPATGEPPEPALEAAERERARLPIAAPPRPARLAAELDAIAIDHCGLVLLWPFLRRLFERLQLIENDGFRSRESRQRSVAVLQHLASGELEPMEFDVPLAKVLCGLPLFDLFELEAPIGAVEAEECARLLQAVADHATEAAGPVLPIERWRREFLTRAGLLTLRDGTWLLQVERAPDDELLDRLPWTWAWVRLPWMESSLRVEW